MGACALVPNLERIYRLCVLSGLSRDFRACANPEVSIPEQSLDAAGNPYPSKGDAVDSVWIWTTVGSACQKARTPSSSAIATLQILFRAPLRRALVIHPRRLGSTGSRDSASIEWPRCPQGAGAQDEGVRSDLVNVWASLLCGGPHGRWLPCHLTTGIVRRASISSSPFRAGGAANLRGMLQCVIRGKVRVR